MGVQGLWELLSPVGHRVNNDHVRNKILAVDISIWLTQFVKAMRDADGAQVRNSHLLGVFRRCVKLLYLSVKPVLVFDGATPALKRKTLSSRRAQREKHAAKLRRLAEKMLLNQVRQRTLGHAIAKKRKTTLQNITAASENKTKTKEVQLTSDDLATKGVDSWENTAQEEESIRFDNSQSGIKTNEEMSSDTYRMASLQNSSEESDIGEAQISAPQNIDDLDDDVLMKLPAKVQAEVFKQVKFEQRSRHRENMMLKKQDPSAFSRTQIEGFLRHTALNRKISRVRNVINSKLGGSQRIASDSKRKFILEEDPHKGIHQEIGASEIEDEPSTLDIPRVGTTRRASTDLLAKIRATKDEKVSGRTPLENQSSKKLKLQRYQESGTGWASKVLEGQGGLFLGVTTPGEDTINFADQLSRESGDDSISRPEKQNLEPTEDTRDVQTKQITQEVNVCGMNDSRSDDDEWEDGDRPVKYDFSSILGKETDPIETDMSKRNDNALRKEQSNEVGEDGLQVSSLEQDLDFQVRSTDEEPKRKCLKQYASMMDKIPTGNITSSVVDGLSPGVDQQRLDMFVNMRSSLSQLPKRLRARHSESDSRKEYAEHNPELVKEIVSEGNSLLDDPPESGLRRIHGHRHLRATGHGSQRVVPGELDTVLLEERSGKTASVLRDDELLVSGQNNEPRGISGFQSKEEVKGVSFKRSHTSNEFTSRRSVPKPCRSVVEIESEAERDKIMDGTGFGNCITSSEIFRGSKDLASNSNRVRPINSCKEGNYTEYQEDEMRKENDRFNSQPDSLAEMSPRRATVTDDVGNVSTPEIVNEGQCRIDSTEPWGISHRDNEGEPSLAQLESMRQRLVIEAEELKRQRSSHRRGVDSVADEMYEEARYLLKLFGIPYLEAPMEAEAQCAFLNMERIVDGVLTEDSDAFLFGAQTVYRQLFAEGRFAEAYDVDDIHLNLGLDRERLVRLAYLLGSDYTAGVRGVGIVNSMEILEAFPGPSGLEEFRAWTKSVTILDKEPEEEVMKGSSLEAVRRRFCWKHRNLKRNWEVREGFPNPAVFEAYMNPIVNKRREKFTWHTVNFEGLAKFCWDKFGWEQETFESAVGPLRQRLRQRYGVNQTRIDEFFKPHRFAKIRSERLQRAVHGIAGEISEELMFAQRPEIGKRRSDLVRHDAKLTDRELIDRDCEGTDDQMK